MSWYQTRCPFHSSFCLKLSQHLRMRITKCGCLTTLCRLPPKAAAPTSFDHLSISARLIKHIPKSARPACSRLLKEILHVTSNPDDKEKWLALLNFCKSYLFPPNCRGKLHNLTDINKNQPNNEDRDDDIVESTPIANMSNRGRLHQ